MRSSAAKTAVLSQNVAHRTACLALYHRLLKHARNVIITGDKSPAPATAAAVSDYTTQVRKSLKTIITKEFKKTTVRELKVPKILDSLKLGYSAEKCLRLATKQPPDATAVLQIVAYIKRYNKAGAKPLRRMQAAKITVQPQPKPVPKRPISPYLKEIPVEYRRKATLVAGNTMPFIRYTGAKPNALLAGMLRKRVEKRAKWDDQLDDLQFWMDLGSWEDVFESKLREEATGEWKKKNPDDGARWVTAAKNSKEELQLNMFEKGVSAYNRVDGLLRKIKKHNTERERLLREVRWKKRESKKHDEDGGVVSGTASGAAPALEEVVIAGGKPSEATKVKADVFRPSGERKKAWDEKARNRLKQVEGRKATTDIRVAKHEESKVPGSRVWVRRQTSLKPHQNQGRKKPLSEDQKADKDILRSLRQAYLGLDHDVDGFLKEFLC
ncbi:hypothetical protein DRE_02157 [Drechslerella stenobrocha 248]|uniref:Uncharacterized protein n=1 Tax=Drechslerella stenobrocha 248 TaxID=1043628 RepID=W7I7S6_9PEZI|nr:hypothetical protein DRE_02157 [Drechslerella stenobrocha 248]